MTDLPIRAGDDALHVNWLEITSPRPDGTVTYRATFVTFVTSIDVDRDNVAELADFYLHEMEEVLGEVGEIESYDDQPVGTLSGPCWVHRFTHWKRQWIPETRRRPFPRTRQQSTHAMRATWRPHSGTSSSRTEARRIRTCKPATVAQPPRSRARNIAALGAPARCESTLSQVECEQLKSNASGTVHVRIAGCAFALKLLQCNVCLLDSRERGNPVNTPRHGSFLTRT